MPCPGRAEAEVYQRAESERADRLEQEVERLRADLRQAEGALVAAESGLRGNHSRAGAVSSLAEARIAVERAARRAPWRSEEISEARAKLDEADAQVRRDNFGAAIFFLYSARRIAADLEREVDQVARARGARFVGVRRANLRRGPSTQEPVVTRLPKGSPVFVERSEDAWALVRTTHGRVGWVHESLLESGPPPAARR